MMDSALLKTVLFMMIFGGLALAMIGVATVLDGRMIGFLIGPIGTFMLVYGFIRALDL